MLIYSNGTFDGWFYVVATGEIRAPDLWSKSDWLHGMVMKQINTKIAYIRCFCDTHLKAITIRTITLTKPIGFELSQHAFITALIIYYRSKRSEQTCPAVCSVYWLPRSEHILLMQLNWIYFMNRGIWLLEWSSDLYFQPARNKHINISCLKSNGACLLMYSYHENQIFTSAEQREQISAKKANFIKLFIL